MKEFSRHGEDDRCSPAGAVREFVARACGEIRICMEDGICNESMSWIIIRNTVDGRVRAYI